MDELDIGKWFIIRPLFTMGCAVYLYFLYEVYVNQDVFIFLLFLSLAIPFGALLYLIWFKMD